MITRSNAAFRFFLIAMGATVATSTIELQAASASTKSYQINGRWYSPHGASGYDESGTASYYGPGFHGRKTANGETYDQWGMTAAHRTLPMGTQVLVTNQRTGKTVNVRINDRGPFAGNRIIDLSTHVAQTLGISGLGQVRVRHAALGAPSNEKSEKRVIASKAKDDDDKPAVKAKPKARAVVAEKPEAESQKASPKPARVRAPASEQERPAKQQREDKSWVGGVADASGSVRLIRQNERIAVAEVQVEWRKALHAVRKA